MHMFKSTGYDKILREFYTLVIVHPFRCPNSLKSFTLFAPGKTLKWFALRSIVML